MPTQAIRFRTLISTPLQASSLPFQPYAVQCTTCGSRLRVADASLIGTIAACPKCQSMVQIEPPGDSSSTDRSTNPIAMGQTPVDSEAITEEGLSSGIAPESDGNTSPPLAGGPAFSADPMESGETEYEATDGPPPVSVDWQSDRTRKTRQTVLIAMLGLSSLFVTGLVFYGFVRSQKPVAEVPAAETTEPPIADEVVDLTPPESVSTEPTPVEPTTNPTPEPDPETNPEAETSADPEPPKMVETLEPDSIIPSSLMPTSPLEGLAPVQQPGQQPEDAVTDPDIGMLEELPPGLQQFTPLLLQGAPQLKATLQAPPSIEQMQLDSAEEVDDLGMKPPPPINVKSDLAIRLAFRSEGYTLPAFLLLIGQATGVPIQIDWVSFDLAGIKMDRPIKPIGKVRTAREWLEEVASQVDGEVTLKETLVMISMTDAAFDAKKQALLSSDDFGDQKASAIETIDAFMNEETDAVNEPNIDAEIEPGLFDEEAEDVTNPAPPEPKLKPRAADQLRILATEMLRRMRGIEPKLPNETFRRWTQLGNATSSDWVELQGGQRLSQVDTPIAAAGFLRRACQANGAVLLVNWDDTNRRGMRPNHLVMPISKTDTAATLATMLGEFNLQVRAVDPAHWWLGSPATYDRLPVIVGTDPMDDPTSAGTFKARMDLILQDAGRDVYRIVLDPVSNRYLMLVPRFVARQLPKVAGK